MFFTVKCEPLLLPARGWGHGWDTSAVRSAKLFAGQPVGDLFVALYRLLPSSPPSCLLPRALCLPPLLCFFLATSALSPFSSSLREAILVYLSSSLVSLGSRTLSGLLGAFCLHGKGCPGSPWHTAGTLHPRRLSQL